MEQITKQEAKKKWIDGAISDEEYKAVLLTLEKQRLEKRQTNNKKRSWLNQGQLIRDAELKGRPTIDDIIRKAKAIDNLNDRSLFVLTYLSGARISEVLALRPYSFERNMRRGLPIFLIRLENKKNRVRKTKEIVISLKTRQERELVNLIIDYLEGLDNEDLIFKYSKVNAFLKIRKLTGWNCHYIRHLRLTHLVIYYGFDTQRLVKWAGWTDDRPAKYYINLLTDDFLDKFPDDSTGN